MTREIEHQDKSLKSDLNLYSVDDAGAGGAYHEYVVTKNLNPGTKEGGENEIARIKFQKGPIKENAINGLTNEILLAVVLDRLQCFQGGPFPCQENKDAAEYVSHALSRLEDRTLDRKKRNVEGTSNA